MNALAGLGRFGLFLGAFARSSVSRPPPLDRVLEEVKRFMAVFPPSIGMIAPVIQLAASDARNTAKP